ncbi:MAG: DUF3368 domain-containing protein [Candidatus Micrarchaeota archaeon]
MKAVIDSVSLIFLLKIPKLEELLNTYVNELFVTDEVWHEVFESKISHELNPISQLNLKVKRKNPRQKIKTNLGAGELSSISLALEERIFFLSDDRKAILFAKSLNLNTATTLSVLIRSKKDKLIDGGEAKKILFELVEKGFYISSELFVEVLKILES